MDRQQNYALNQLLLLNDDMRQSLQINDVLNDVDEEIMIDIVALHRRASLASKEEHEEEEKYDHVELDDLKRY